jgi:hypothetical protein
MRGGLMGGGRVEAPDVLDVAEELVAHARVLSPDRTVHNRRTGPLVDCTSRAHGDCAVDDRQAWFEALDVASGLAYEVVDLERETDVHDGDRRAIVRRRRLDIYPDNVEPSAEKFEQGPADFTQADNDHPL